MPDIVQRILGFVGAILTAPVLLVLAIAVKLDDSGPALYSAQRVGEAGRIFRCFKLRTMCVGQKGGSAITASSDPRVTRLGRLLRRSHLDELPQLWNVARGEMRFVGPRPEDPRFVDMTRPLHRLVFSAKPGITGLTQLVNVDEEKHNSAVDTERVYRDDVLPAKLRVDAAYLRRRSTGLDVWIIAQTPRAIFGRPVRLPAILVDEVESGAADGSGGAQI
jgi:lipopolysaccharide/colanic/teichoic acid biosynthesis glycosyltransferase